MTAAGYEIDSDQAREQKQRSGQRSRLKRVEKKNRVRSGFDDGSR